jgi:hypothetical protein
MKQILSFTLLLCFILGYSQIKYESGYYINAQNVKVNGFIRNMDWNSNPTSIEFKSSLDGESKIKTIQEVKEFGIYDKSKYVRFEVEMDRSSDELDNLSHQRNPEFKKEIVLLETLIEGKSSLYSYKESQFTRFFFQNEKEEITSLINKRYFIDVNKVATNEGFKNQLRAKVNCNATDNKITSLRYNRNSLTKYFKDYNTCRNAEIIDYSEIDTKSKFNLYGKAGLSFASLDIENSVLNNSYSEFDNKIVLKFGVEFEYLLPFQKNKWALFFSPTYKAYKSEGKNMLGDRKSSVEYNSIELPLGVRHYFILNKTSKIFVHGGILWDMNLSGELQYHNYADKLDISSGNNFMFGLGYNFKSKITAEFNIFSARSILSDYANWSSHYNNLEFKIGYNFL